MAHNPDWEALHQLNFLLAPRISSPLNEALNALAIADIDDPAIDPQIWQEKARARIANLLNLYQAWSALIQYKNGLQLPQHSIRAFPLQSLLDWLTIQLELTLPATAPENIHLLGNQASIQEALLLLHSAAATQGSNVHLNLENSPEGYWFRIRFSRPSPLPPTLEEIIGQFSNHWRSQDSAFELKMAQDFIALNDGKIDVQWNSYKRLGEFAFCVKQTAAETFVHPIASPDMEHAKLVANLHRALPAPSPAEGADHQAEEQAESTESLAMNNLSKGERLLIDLRKMDTDRTMLLPDDEPTLTMNLTQLQSELAPHIEADTLRVIPPDEVKTPHESSETNSPKVMAGKPPAI